MKKISILLAILFSGISAQAHQVTMEFNVSNDAVVSAMGLLGVNPTSGFVLNVSSSDGKDLVEIKCTQSTISYVFSYANKNTLSGGVGSYLQVSRGEDCATQLNNIKTKINSNDQSIIRVDVGNGEITVLNDSDVELL